LTTVCFFASVAAADARPGFELAERSARAGDVVHFSISGADGAPYELYLDGTQIASGIASSGGGAFTLPDLGSDGWTVTVGAEIRRSGRHNWLESELDYLGRALPPPAPPPAETAAPEGATSSPGPVSAPKLVDGTSPGGPAKTVQPQRRHPWPKGRKGRAVDTQSTSPRRSGHRRRAARAHARRKHRAGDGKSRSKRSRRRHLRPLPGTYEPGHVPPGATEQAPRDPGTPKSGVPLATAAHAGGTSTASVVVPALLGLAALTLAGMALLRRRELASRRPRD